MNSAPQLPKYHETFLPILKTINQEGALTYGELRKKVRDLFYSHLPEELLLEKTKSGDTLILNRIGWGKAYLKKAGLLRQQGRGAPVELTEKGTRVLQTGKYTLEDLIEDPEYQAREQITKGQKRSVLDSLDKTASPQDLIDAGITEIEAQVKDELLERLRHVDPYYFEEIVLQLLQKMGYGDFIPTSKSGDGGIDGIINQDQLGIEKIYIQAKRFNENKVREKDIRNFIGAMAGGTQKGVFVTTSEFDDKAIEKARDFSGTIILVDGAKFIDLIYEHDIGVQTKNSYSVKEVDEDYFENE